MNKPKRRVCECYLCSDTFRTLGMHAVYFTGNDKAAAPPIPAQYVVDKEVRICDGCFRAVGYYLKPDAAPEEDVPELDLTLTDEVEGENDE